MPHLNALHERLFGKGLVVVGVTGEDKADVAAYVAKNEVRYPVGIGWAEDYRVRGIPAAFLIDPSGKLVWRGHPASLDDATIAAALQGARPATVAAGLEDVNRLQQEGRHGAAHARVVELLAGGTLSAEATAQGQEVQAAIERTVADAVDGAAKALAGGDPYTAFARLDPVVSAYAGVPRHDEAKARLTALLADNRNKREIEAGRKFAAAQALEQARDFDGAYKAYKALNGYSTTRAGKAASAAWRALEKDGKLGYLRGCGACEAIGRACPAHAKKHL